MFDYFFQNLRFCEKCPVFPQNLKRFFAGVQNDKNTFLVPYCLSNLVSSEKAAFTLAEVLITLGIIGIVAAMTIPNLISSYKAKLYGTRLKEFYSIMSQAVMLSEIQNGPKNTWKKHSLDENYDQDGNLDYEASYSYNYDFFNTYIAPFIKYTNESIKDNSTFYLINGTKVYMWNGSCVDMNVDVNGDAPPNQGGYDSFNFQLCLNAKYNITPGASCDNYTREECLEKCKENTNYCSSLLKLDNWQFKEDYPYKL